MRRWTLHLSLLICIAVIIVGAASYTTTLGWASDHHFWSQGVVRWSAATRRHALIIADGVLYEVGEEFTDTRLTGRPMMDEHRVLSGDDLAGLRRGPTTYGFSWNQNVEVWGVPPFAYERYWQRSVPLWLFMFPGVIAPTIWLLRFLGARRRNARLRGGRCPVCGYDLRAATTRCPECGTAMLA